MLVTQLDLDVIGFEHIKDLYKHDPTFATPYAKCLTHTSWERYCRMWGSGKPLRFEHWGAREVFPSYQSTP